MNVQGLLGGSLDMIVAVGSGIGCKSGHEPSCDGFVCAAKYCYSNDLAGQVIGITRYNSSTHAVATLVLGKLDLETAATVRSMGDASSV
jgi:hypothetical protein